MEIAEESLNRDYNGIVNFLEFYDTCKRRLNDTLSSVEWFVLMFN